MSTEEKTARLIIEADPATVEAVAARLRRFFTVTYESTNDTHIAHSNRVRRHLNLLPPNQAHNSREASS